ncbi:MAG: hypothetical protein LC687_05635 [Actinobacteria bacterium]|nr:hypothetical protein [Actinomycetota bacterium]MCA1807313.1 hypothetical protein [Actinomycetota bacterium]
MALPQPTPQQFNKLEILDEFENILGVVEYIIDIKDEFRLNFSGDRAYNSTVWSAFGDGLRAYEPVEVEGILLVRPYNHNYATVQLTTLAEAVVNAKKIRYGFFTRAVARGLYLSRQRVASGFKITLGFIPSSDTWLDSQGNAVRMVG